jgi:hypothetical protein
MRKIRGRVRPEVDNYVEDDAAHASDQLGFFERAYLEMHATDRAGALSDTHVALCYDVSQSLFSKLICTESAREITPLVQVGLHIDIECPFDGSLGEDH